MARPRDDRGWRIPRPGTRSYEIYHLLLAGFKSGEIIELYQEDWSHSSIGVLIHRIKHPDQNNKWSNDWHHNNPKRTKEIADAGKKRFKSSNSKYIEKLVRVLGISYDEARELERKELEKVK